MKTTPHPIIALVFTLSTLCSCEMAGPIKNSLAFENRIFVRVPGAPPGQHMAVSEGTDGWNFKHVLAGPKSGGSGGPEAQWYLAWNDDPDRVNLKGTSTFKLLTTGTPLRHSDWRKVAELTPEIARAAYAAFKVYPQMVQPELIYKVSEEQHTHTAGRTRMTRQVNFNPAELELGEPPESAWSRVRDENHNFDPVWHLDEHHSQLAKARERVRGKPGNPGRDITIGILDTGFDKSHIMNPARLTDEARGDAINMLHCGAGACSTATPGDAKIYHGLGTMSVLAAGKFRLVDKWDARFKRLNTQAKKQITEREIEFGGAPDAHIVAARVAPFVVSVSTANLAYAIDYASRVKQCDVISMSHGGSPSPLWIDAVNAAYDRGTAIFAATADYYNLPMINLGIGAPSATVFPAACRRVMGVAGVTAEGQPYGRTEWRHYWSQLFNPLKWLHMRGSYGADGVYRHIWHGLAPNENARTDKSQRERLGLLRANPICAYTPGVAWAELPSRVAGPGKDRPDVVRINGGGTSAATPQAAAAAAHWIAFHQDEIRRAKAAGDLQDWEIPEAVYVAMLKSAQKTKSMRRTDDEWQISKRQPDVFCGAGSLKASDMLDISLAEARGTHKPELWFPNKTKPIPGRTGDDKRKKVKAPSDRYDGSRSGAAVLGLRLELPPYPQRADPRIGGNTRLTEAGQLQEALTNIYYNQLIVQQWNIGFIPLKPDGGYRLGPDEKPLHKSWIRRLFSPDEKEIAQSAEDLAASTSAR